MRWRRPGVGLALCVISALTVWSGCSSGSPAGPSGQTAGQTGGQTTGEMSASSAQVYASQCASCHGTFGEGGLGSPLRGLEDRAALARKIATTMPPAQPSACEGACAEQMADFLLASFPAEQVDCTQPQLPPRRLRLLTRREYDATIRELFGGLIDASSAGSCVTDAQCDVRRQRCDGGGQCVATACDVQTFVYDAGGESPRTVHVAGSFNGWAPTISGGGLRMAYLEGAGVWVARAQLGSGRHEYKFVVDETRWLNDPANPLTVDDTLGGLNSVVELRCDGAASPDSFTTFDRRWSEPFPLESRPEGFLYDSHVEARATTTHVDEYLRAGAQIATLATRDAGSVAKLTGGCDGSGDRQACAEAFVGRFGSRALRRPLTEAERARYVAHVMAEEALADGLARAIQVMLSSPHFLYRSELGEAQGDGTYRLSAYEIASALSYQLWGTMPDQALMDAAASGGLDTAAGIKAQAERLLADPRSEAMVATFAEQWLGLEALESKVKDPNQFPQFTDALRQAMRLETRRFVQHVVFQGTGKLDELLEADYTFANAALASLYDIPGVEGDALRIVRYPHGRRAGLLGHASLLATTSHSDQTSPVRRGLLVRQRLLCQEFPPPPANAGGVPEVDPNATTRERFRQHSSDPSCASCHRYIDEVGFGFERFDALGAWREREAGQMIDPAGKIEDIEGFGSASTLHFNTQPQLASLLAQSERAAACFTLQYYRFARGELEAARDQCAVEALQAQFVASGRDIKALMIATTQTPEFTRRARAAQ